MRTIRWLNNTNSVKKFFNDCRRTKIAVWCLRCVGQPFLCSTWEPGPPRHALGESPDAPAWTEVAHEMK